jgi:actinin alpha 1/4
VSLFVRNSAANVILVASFRLQAGSLNNWVAVKTKLVQSEVLGDTVDSVSAALRNLEAFHEDYTAQSSKLTVLADLSHKLADGKSADADAVASELSTLQGSWDSLQPMHASRKAALEAQLEKLQAIQTMLVDFAKKALAFARFAEDSTQALGEPVLVDSVEEVAALETRLGEIAASVAHRQGDLADLESLASKLHEAGVEETTYSEYSIGDIKQHHSSVDAAVAERKKVLAAEHATQLKNEELRKQWASEATSFSEWCNGRESALKERSANPGSNEAELKATLSHIEAFRAELHSNQSKFDAVSHLAQQLEDAEITENKHSTLTFEGLKLQWDALFALQANSQKIIENEILLKAHSGVTDEQLAEFKSAFAHFDKDNSGHLNRLEFKSCLQSLGEELKDPEIEALMNEFGLLIEENGLTTRQLPFNSFVAYMIKKHSNTDNAQAIVESFSTIAGGKEFVTANDLRSVLPNDKVDYLLAHMPKYAAVEDGYDYKSYAATLYA